MAIFSTNAIRYGLIAVLVHSVFTDALGQEAAPATAAAPVSSGAPGSSPDLSNVQSKALLTAIDKILKKAADERDAAKTVPGREKYLFPPIWTETRQDHENTVRQLLDGALEIVTDAPILKFQADIKRHRDQIVSLRDQIAQLREKRMEAPAAGFIPNLLNETRDAIDKSIVQLQADIKTHEAEITALKKNIGQALAAAGITLSNDQLELLLDSVLGNDLLKLVTAFEVAKVADQRLSILIKQSNEDLKTARRYFAMHAALFAMLVQAQTLLIQQIDTVYLARLDFVLKDIERLRQQTRDLMASQTRDDQKKMLEANLKSQDISEKVATFYRDYLHNQRKMLIEAREKTMFDLRIADNTFETVEASFQLRILMDDARTSFDALQKLETPGFDQIFRNENLKREFENLTQKLGPAS